MKKHALDQFFLPLVRLSILGPPRVLPFARPLVPRRLDPGDIGIIQGISGSSSGYRDHPGDIGIIQGISGSSRGYRDPGDIELLSLLLAWCCRGLFAIREEFPSRGTKEVGTRSALRTDVSLLW